MRVYYKALIINFSLGHDSHSTYHDILKQIKVKDNIFSLQKSNYFQADKYEIRNH